MDWGQRYSVSSPNYKFRGIIHDAETERRLRFSSVALSGAGAAFILDASNNDESPPLIPPEGYERLDDHGETADQPPPADRATRQKTLIACCLILVTDIVATLQSATLVILQDRGFAMLSLLLISSLVGVIFCGSLMLVRRLPFVRDPKSKVALFERGVLGGVANMCAFVAVSMLNLGVASCLMFTMPLWTALLAYLLIGQKWQLHDLFLALSCLTGVVLVTEIWNADNGEDTTSQWIGMGAALVFAVISADAALVVNTRLRGEAPLSMVLATMLCASALAASLALATGVSLLPSRHASSADSFLGVGMDNARDATTTTSGGSGSGDDDEGEGGALSASEKVKDVALVAALSLSLPVMMLTRNKAFTLSSDTSVSMLLYLEIALAFVWQSVLLGAAPPSPSQGVGAALIVGGSCCSVLMKGRCRREHSPVATTKSRPDLLVNDSQRASQEDMEEQTSLGTGSEIPRHGNGSHHQIPNPIQTSAI